MSNPPLKVIELEFSCAPRYWKNDGLNEIFDPKFLIMADFGLFAKSQTGVAALHIDYCCLDYSHLDYCCLDNCFLN